MKQRQARKNSLVDRAVRQDDTKLVNCEVGKRVARV
jgi:hypothetical protein